MKERNPTIKCILEDLESHIKYIVRFSVEKEGEFSSLEEILESLKKFYRIKKSNFYVDER